MKLNILPSTLVLGLTSAIPQYQQNADVAIGLEVGDWIAAGPEAVRGPCPMMNTLANHGFLPRDGRNITKDNAVFALNTGLNFDIPLATLMWEQALFSNPEPNATFFTLEHLAVHNVLEHDASLSRPDAAFGNQQPFNQTVFNTTKQFWTADILTADMLANAKVFRQVQSRASNANYTFTATVENFSLGELAAPILVFGDIPAETVRRDLVISFFENERLPTELGWTKQATPILLTEVLHLSGVIANSSKLLTPGGAAHKKRSLAISHDIHTGQTLKF